MFTMTTMISISLLITTLILLLLSINMIISKKSIIDREKASSYECGFDPLNATSESFSIQFFLISIMFLTFDMEIVMLIPMITSMHMKSFYWLISSSFIMIILIIGIYLEWSESSIKWEK